MFVSFDIVWWVAASVFAQCVRWVAFERVPIFQRCGPASVLLRASHLVAGRRTG